MPFLCSVRLPTLCPAPACACGRSTSVIVRPQFVVRPQSPHGLVTLSGSFTLLLSGPVLSVSLLSLVFSRLFITILALRRSCAAAWPPFDRAGSHYPMLVFPHFLMPFSPFLLLLLAVLPGSPGSSSCPPCSPSPCLCWYVVIIVVIIAVVAVVAIILVVVVAIMGVGGVDGGKL